MEKVKVYVAVFIYHGVLNNLEVCKSREKAEQFAKNWQKESNPDHDVVDVQERVIVE